MSIQVETLGQKIKRIRLEKNMNQSQVAADFVTVSMINQIENDKNTASIELLNHIARKLQIPLHELVQDETDQMEWQTKHQLAKVYLESRQPLSAEPLLHELLTRTDLTQAKEIEIYLDLAVAQYQQALYHEIIHTLQPLIEQLEKVNFDDDQLLAAIHHRLGNTYYQKQQLTDAAYHFRRAFDLTTRFPKLNALAAKISYNLGITLRQIGKSPDAIPHLNRAYEFYKHNGELVHLASARYELGIAYKNARSFSRAAEYFEEAKTIFAALNLVEQSYIVQQTMASTITALNDPGQAINELSACIPQFENDKKYALLSFCHIKIAAIYLSQENWWKAEEHLSHSDCVIQTHSLEDSPAGGEYFLTLARYHLKSKNHIKSIEIALKAQQIYGKIGLIPEQIDALQVTSEAYTELGDYKMAYDYQLKSNHLYRELNQRREMIL